MVELQPSKLVVPVRSRSPAPPKGAGYTSLDQLAYVSETDLGRLHGVGPNAIENRGELSPRVAFPSPRTVEPQQSADRPPPYDEPTTFDLGHPAAAPADVAVCQV